MLIDGSGLFAGLRFHPVIPTLRAGEYLVRDFTSGPDERPLAELGFAHDVGRYNERRPAMYDATNSIEVAGFADAHKREIHVGVDIGGAVNTPVHAFCDGVVHCCGYNSAKGDYGNVIVTEQTLAGRRVWALYGHLSAQSIVGRAAGQAVKGGEVLGWLGAPHENGGWPPHVHLQLSLTEPATHDLPGVVSAQSHAQALLEFPDPRMVLGLSTTATRSACRACATRRTTRVRDKRGAARGTLEYTYPVLGTSYRVLGGRRRRRGPRPQLRQRPRRRAARRLCL